MPHLASKSASSATSGDPFDLNLPEIGEGEGPLGHPEPTFEEQIAHARFLLTTIPPDFYERRRGSMNSEPFRLP